MTAHLLVTFFCPDRTGLVSGVTGALFDLGANLGDTTFAVLGGGAEFTTICSLPDDVTADHVTDRLRALPELAEAELTVEPFTLSPEQGPTGDVTHRIVLIGGDQPGLIARLSEVFVQFGANIVRIEARRVPDAPGHRYETRFAVWIPEEKAQSCLATVANTAGELSLDCRWQAD